MSIRLNRKFVFVFLILVFVVFSVSTQEIGKPIYKEVTVNGEKLFKWVKLDSFAEYDLNGNKIHTKGTFSGENWYKYDYEGNLIYE